MAPCSNRPKQTKITLNHLPLRPSTLKLLSNRGFVTWDEILESKEDGSIMTFASELNVEVQQATNIYREIYTCIQKLLHPINKNDDDGDGGGNENSSSGARGNNRNHALSSSLLSSSKSMTASQLLNLSSSSHYDNTIHSNNNPSSIITFSRGIDQILSGGIAFGELTELHVSCATRRRYSSLYLSKSLFVGLPLTHGLPVCACA